MDVKLCAYNCRLLIVFANSLDSDQGRRFVVSDLYTIVWHSDSIPEIIFRKIGLKRKKAIDKKHAKLQLKDMHIKNSSGGPMM